MTAATILSTVRTRGARLYVTADGKIAASPRTAIDDQLKAEILRHKPALVAILKSAVSIAAYSTREDLAMQEWAERHTHPDVLPVFGQLARRCDALASGTAEAAYHAAVERLVGYLAAIRAAYEANQAHLEAPALAPTPGQWRVVVGPMNLRPAPIVIDRGRTVVGNVPGFVESVLADLEVAVEHRNEGRGGYEDSLLDEYIDHLHRCGVAVSLELLQ